MQDINELYCLMDDFCKKFEPILNAKRLTDGAKKRIRASSLSLAELMTLVILFHQIRYRQFKSFYLHHVCQHLRREFPTLPSYSRFIELLPRCAIALYAFFETVKGDCSGCSVLMNSASKLIPKALLNKGSTRKCLSQHLKQN
ncbi:hypothetical protein CJJ19_00580 [Candidatus Williamhamiltonella defendens]|nr:hypothetical protein CJJ19_00580 [Candidatus Hamiltonella defensa]